MEQPPHHTGGGTLQRDSFARCTMLHPFGKRHNSHHTQVQEKIQKLETDVQELRGQATKSN